MEIYRRALELLSSGQSFSVGIVVYARGSTPQKAGAKALADETGILWGTLGGGAVEAQGVERMKESLRERRPILCECPLDEPYSRDAGPICGGTMRIFSYPLSPEDESCIRRAVEACERGQCGALVTWLSGGTGAGRLQWFEENSFDSAEAEPLADTLNRCTCESGPFHYVADNGDEAFVEPVRCLPRLLVVGGGHVGQAAALQGSLLGFDVTVLDDRPAFTNPNLFPCGTTTICGDIRTEVSKFPKGPNAYIVLVSKGHRPDAEALEGCIRSDSTYIGMIGSQRKIESLRKHFVEKGLATREEFDRIVAPIGIDIGAVTVPEIGVSIGAQLVAARRLGTAASAVA